MTDPLFDNVPDRAQAVRYKAVLKEVREFRAYCCDIDTNSIMGVAKEPVIILDVSPNPICLGFSIDWDMTQSYAPGSTVSSWSINFGDSNSDSGASIGTASGTHIYAAAGTYTISATVTEGLGKTQTSELEVNVITCSDGPTTLGSWTYISSDGQGVYFIDWSEGTPTWTSRNTGLEGNALFVRSLVIKPATKHLSDDNHILWAATLDGVYKSENGGRSWGKINLPDPSNVEFVDDPAATVDELDFHHIVFDPNDEDKVFVLASKEGV